MIDYLYLPYTKCKQCKHFDITCSRYYKCYGDKCPAKEVKLVIKDSVQHLVRQYRKAVKEANINDLNEVLAKVRSFGKAYEYKFTKEIKNEDR